MREERTGGDTWAWDAEGISEGGERVSHLRRDAGFYAHLSIYRFAARFCHDAVVLDAGSGAGYGAAYLADAGARHVTGIDASARAVTFSAFHFQRPNLEFREMRLDRIRSFPDRHFDVIYTSNTLEHVPDMAAFLHAGWRLLKPDGLLLVAVPPITSERLEYLNVINPYHLHIWSPRQWRDVLAQFFCEVTSYVHGVEEIGADFKPEHLGPDSTLTEEGFVFAPASVEDMDRMFTLTAIFCARQPRPAAQLPPRKARLPFVDASYTRRPGHIPRKVRRRLAPYFPDSRPDQGERGLLGRAVDVLRIGGPVALAQEAARFARYTLGRAGSRRKG